MADYPIADYQEHDELKLKEIWEPRKEYISGDLWVIRNFLSTEEIDYLMTLANDDTGWYSTMRSPYGGNVRNKFIGLIPQYDENGIMLLPNEDSPRFVDKYYSFAVESRVRAVVEPTSNGVGAFQSFYAIPEEQIIAELGHTVDYAMNWHHERDDDRGEYGRPETSTATAKVTGTYSIYLNDDFDGGVLEFKDHDFVVKAEPGMLVNIPLFRDYTHRITKVTNGVRHSLYGQSWDDFSNRHVSSNADC